MKRQILFILLSVVMISGVSWAQTVSISAGNTYTQNFDSIGTSATGTLPYAWKAALNSTAVRTVGTYASAGTATTQLAGNSMGSTATFGIYNYGAGVAASATDRALGALSTSNTASKGANFYTVLKNNGAGSISSFTISYDVEKYRLGTNAAGFSMQMYYSTDGTSWTSAGSDFLTSFAGGDATNNGYASAPGASSSVSSKTLSVSVNAGSSLYLAWNYSVSSGTTTSSAQGLGIDNVSITAVSSAIASPALTAAAGATVDAAFDVTFTDVSAWRTGISVITVNGTTLAGAAYSTGTAGKITFTPSLSTLLQSPGSKTILITSTGYTVDTVVQTINVGAASASTSTASISATLTLNGTKTVTATAKDQYNNPISAYVFKFIPTITNNSGTTNESYTVNSSSYTTTAIAQSLSATNGSGVVTFNITIPAAVDGGDGISVQVKLNNGTTNVGSAFAFTQPTTPALNIASSALTESNLSGSQVSLTLINETFTDGTLSPGNFTLNNAPSGTSIGSVAYNSNTTATVTLTFNGTDFDSDVTNFSITIAGAELTSASPVTSNTLSISAVTEVLPTVTTTSISGITVSTASSGGNVTADGGATVSGAVTARGICYSTTQGAESVSGNITINGTGTGTFSSSITGLAANTTYYVKAYATNGVGTNYGSEVSFTTSGLTAPTSKYGTNFSTTGFTANWSPVEGATSYRIDVYTQSAATLASDLFISEYLEGTSNNKYIEIFNGTGASVDLSAYSLVLYANGTATATATNALSGTLANNAVVVYKNSSGALTLPAGVTATTNGSLNYNGDDAIALQKGATLIDVFGRIGEDPGTAWTSGSFSTLDKTLVRNSSVAGGITTNPASGFPTLSTEWIQYATDVASNLGSHTFAGSPTISYVIQDATVNDTTYAVSSLSANTKYYYRVRAYSTNSLSANSSSIVLTTPNEVSAPTVSTGTSVSVPVTGTSGISNITFDNVSSGGTLNVTRYADTASNTSSIPLANKSLFRWIIEPSEGFSYSGGYVLTFKRADIHGVAELNEGDNTTVKLYKRSTPGSGSFTDEGYLTYHRNGTDGDITDDYLVSETINDGFSEFVIASDGAELPVELTSFASTSTGRNILLTWKTATEVNSAKFIVERSKSSANTWVNVVDIKASGKSNAPKVYSFTDRNLSTGSYNYRLKMVDNDGTYEYSPVIEGSVGTPTEFSVAQNYPNPFNPSTKISFDLPRDAKVTLELFSITGARVASLMSESKPAGYHDFTLNMNAYNLPSGVYMYKLSGNESLSGKQFSQVKKLVYLK